jgi:hypothetical protein
MLSELENYLLILTYSNIIQIQNSSGQMNGSEQGSIQFLVNETQFDGEEFKIMATDRKNPDKRNGLDSFFKVVKKAPVKRVNPLTTKNKPVNKKPPRRVRKYICFLFVKFVLSMDIGFLLGVIHKSTTQNFHCLGSLQNTMLQ